jgi:DNA-binding XRE family transcriptional regulator
MPNKVRLARTMLAINQAHVARMAGFTNPQLSDIERGEYKDIPLENSRALSDFFGCQIEDLFPAREAVAS